MGRSRSQLQIISLLRTGKSIPEVAEAKGHWQRRIKRPIHRYIAEGIEAIGDGRCNNVGAALLLDEAEAGELVATPGAAVEARAFDEHRRGLCPIIRKVRAAKIRRLIAHLPSLRVALPLCFRAAEPRSSMISLARIRHEEVPPSSDLRYNSVG
jgi:hypothetical protein